MPSINEDQRQRLVEVEHAIHNLNQAILAAADHNIFITVSFNNRAHRFVPHITSFDCKFWMGVQDFNAEDILDA